MILPKPCSLQNLSQLQPAIERWMGSLISISNTDCSKMYFVWNEVVGNFSSISMHVLFPLCRNYFTLVKHCNLVFQWRRGFLLTAWGELTDGNFSWYGEGFWNAIPYDLTLGTFLILSDGVGCTPKSRTAVQKFHYKHFRTYQLEGHYLWLGILFLQAEKAYVQFGNLEGNTWHLVEVPQQGGWSVAGRA